MFKFYVVGDSNDAYDKRSIIIIYTHHMNNITNPNNFMKILEMLRRENIF